jgi:hypothetical protein
MLLVYSRDSEVSDHEYLEAFGFSFGQSRCFWPVKDLELKEEKFNEKDTGPHQARC